MPDRPWWDIVGPLVGKASETLAPDPTFGAPRVLRGDGFTATLTDVQRVDEPNPRARLTPGRPAYDPALAAETLSFRADNRNQLERLRDRLLTGGYDLLDRASQPFLGFGQDQYQEPEPPPRDAGDFFSRTLPISAARTIMNLPFLPINAGAGLAKGAIDTQQALDVARRRYGAANAAEAGGFPGDAQTLRRWAGQSRGDATRGLVNTAAQVGGMALGGAPGAVAGALGGPELGTLATRGVDAAMEELKQRFLSDPASVALQAGALAHVPAVQKGARAVVAGARSAAAPAMRAAGTAFEAPMWAMMGAGGAGGGGKRAQPSLFDRAAQVSDPVSRAAMILSELRAGGVPEESIAHVLGGMFGPLDMNAVNAVAEQTRVGKPRGVEGAPTDGTPLWSDSGPTPAQIADAAVAAAGIVDSAPNFQQWSQEMLAKFGPGFQPHLQEVWARAHAIKGLTANSYDNLKASVPDVAHWKDWYERYNNVLRENFGDNADIFLKFMGATSQAASVSSNVGLALKAYSQWLAGEPFEGYLPAVKGNLETIAKSLPARGQKIGNYSRANEGDAGGVAIDRHVARLFWDTDRPSAAQYAQGVEVVKNLAAQNGWEPRQMQAALWALNQVRRGVPEDKIGSYDTQLKNPANQQRIAALRQRFGELAAPNAPGGERGVRPAGAAAGPAGADDAAGAGAAAPNPAAGSTGPSNAAGGVILGGGLGGLQSVYERWLESRAGGKSAPPAEPAPPTSPPTRADVAQQQRQMAGLRSRRADATSPQTSGKPADLSALKTRLMQGSDPLTGQGRLDMEVPPTPGPPKSAIDHLSEVLSVPRAVMTSFDFSGLGAQGGKLVVTHPVVALKALPAMVKANLSEHAYDQSRADLVTRQAERYGDREFYKKVGLDLSGLDGSREEAFGNPTLAEKIPGVGKGIRGSERAYTTVLNELRAGAFDALYHPSMTQAELEGIAAYVNVASDRADLRGPRMQAIKNAMPAAATALFSPRALASRIQYLSGQPLIVAGGPKARAAIAREYIKYAAAVSTYIGLASASGLADVEKDPRSSDFGKIRWKGSHVESDPVGNLRSYIVLASRLATGETKGADGVVKPGRDLRGGLHTFLDNKMAPVPAAAVNIATRKDTMGKPASLKSEALKMLAPMGVTEFVKGLVEEGTDPKTASQLALVLGLQTLGVGAQYRNRPKEAAAREKMPTSAAALRRRLMGESPAEQTRRLKRELMK